MSLRGHKRRKLQKCCPRSLGASMPCAMPALFAPLLLPLRFLIPLALEVSPALLLLPLATVLLLLFRTFCPLAARRSLTLVLASYPPGRARLRGGREGSREGGREGGGVPWLPLWYHRLRCSRSTSGWLCALPSCCRLSLLLPFFPTPHLLPYPLLHPLLPLLSRFLERAEPKACSGAEEERKGVYFGAFTFRVLRTPCEITYFIASNRSITTTKPSAFTNRKRGEQRKKKHAKCGGGGG